MNPEDNQPNLGQVGPAGTTGPVPPEQTPQPASVAPDLSQVAADLAAAAESNTLESSDVATGITDSATAPTPEAVSPVPDPTVPEVPASQPTPVAPVEKPVENFSAPATEPVQSGPVNLAPLSPEEAAQTEQPTPMEPTTPTETPIEPSSVIPNETPVAPPASPENPVSSENIASPVQPTTVDNSSAMDAALSESPMASTEESPMEQSSATTEPPVENAPDQGNENTSQLADFTNENQPENKTASSESAEDIVYEPAAPVPGSIGSALAYSEDAPGHAVPVVHEKDKTKKKNIQLILIIVGAIALIAVVVVIILFIVSGSSNSKTTTTATTVVPTKPVMSSLTCTLSDDPANLQLYGALSAEEKIIISYSDDELYDISSTISANFLDADTAALGEMNFKKLYSDKVAAAGLTQDPFDSTYTRNDTSVTAMHYAEADLIDETTASIFDIPVDTDGEIDTTIDTLKQVYKNLRYACSSRNTTK